MVRPGPGRSVGSLKMHEIPPMLCRRRCRFGVSAMGDDTILVTGGEIAMGQSSVRSCEMYTLKSNRWRNVSPMRQSRFCHAQVTLNSGKVMVCGGDCLESLVSPITSVEIYSPKLDAWTTATPLPKPMWLHEAVVVPEGTVVVAGGITQKDAATGFKSLHVFLYDPKSDVWTTVVFGALRGSDLIFKRFLLGCGNTINITLSTGGQFLIDYRAGVVGRTSDKANIWAQGPGGDLALRNGKIQYVTNGQTRKHLSTGLDSKSIHFLDPVFLDNGLFVIFDTNRQLYGARTNIMISDTKVLRWSRGGHKHLRANKKRGAIAIILSLLRAGFDTAEMIEGILGELHMFELGLD